MNAKELFEKLKNALERKSPEALTISIDLINFLLIRSNTAGVSNIDIDSLQTAYTKYAAPETKLQKSIKKFKNRLEGV